MDHVRLSSRLSPRWKGVHQSAFFRYRLARIVDATTLDIDLYPSRGEDIPYIHTKDCVIMHNHIIELVFRIYYFMILYIRISIYIYVYFFLLLFTLHVLLCLFFYVDRSL